MEREKRVAIFKIKDIWFDKKAYFDSKKGITILHTNDVLDVKDYDMVLTEKTILISLKGSEEEIFRGFDYKSTRYCINRAMREGIKVVKISDESLLLQYLKFEQSFCNDRNIPTVTYEDLNDLECYSAYAADDEYLGGCSFLVSADGKTGRYKYGATKHKQGANETILWKAMCDLKQKGIENFDMGGIVFTDDKSSYYYGHSKFKQKFGGVAIDSFSYIKAKGIKKIFVLPLKFIVNKFFNGKLNDFATKLHHWKLL